MLWLLIFDPRIAGRISNGDWQATAGWKWIFKEIIIRSQFWYKSAQVWDWCSREVDNKDKGNVAYFELELKKGNILRNKYLQVTPCREEILGANELIIIMPPSSLACLQLNQSLLKCDDLLLYD